ncbi:ABC transporter permease [Chryseolinea sp. H1M3-3]|uniref:ABC transporter permease n=1 Tax=Chryseolinea sp. H1M3-3 TaxID=3034144 RepID=UPI0023EB6BA2|nr:ABC transporter permease [Chryseolinea sp. H1M3-3]
MIKSYIKIALRKLVRNQAYSIINIGGLAAGMTVAMLIGLWVYDELSFDSYFHNHRQLAQVMVNQTTGGQTYTGGTVAMPLGDALRTKYGADLKAVSLTSWIDGHLITTGEKTVSSSGMWVQRDFPEMFSLAMIRGSRHVLKDPSTVLISQSLAKSLFGDGDPLNKSLRIDNRLDMIIGGVYEDLPHNTTFYSSNIFLPWDHKDNWRNSQTSWSNHCGQLFVQLGDKANLEETSEKIKNVPTPFITDVKEEVMLHPMEKLHLYDEFENAKAAGGRIDLVWLIGVIGVFVLFLACINFMNLSTARSEKRSKEVGIRKTVGSLRAQLIGQFLSESIVVALIAFIFSIILSQLSLSFFNQLADKRISLPLDHPVFWLLALSFTLFTGIISGSYPAFYLSGFKPIKVLKGTFKAGRFASLPRKILVVTQFTVSITLIIGTLIVFRQIEFAKNRNPGFSRNGLITVWLNTPDLEKHREAIQNEVLQTNAVEHMALASQSPAHFSNNNGIDWRGKDPGLTVYFRNVDVTPEFGKTLGWKISQGRDFIPNAAGDSASVIINETALKIMGLQEPLGEVIQYQNKNYNIVGVVEDIATQSPYRKNEPSIFFTDGWKGLFIMRLNSSMPVREALAKIEPVFKKHNPDAPFGYSFVDVEYQRKFSNEQKIGSLAGSFAVLAVFISCLGLFGLASYVAEQRTKEIGIRKVLGASVLNLWKMLSKDFVALVIIACAISTPISFIFMNDWLQNFEYRAPISWTMFAMVSVGTLVITLLTVSFQAITAAVANPIRSLRTE